MKYKYLIIFLLLLSCTTTSMNGYKKPSFSSKGFAFIYTNDDYEKKIIKKQFKTDQIVVGHNNLRRGVVIKITNPRNGKSIMAKNSFKIDYPDFYKILISKKVSKHIGLNEDFPFVEIEQIRKNKSFVAERAETFDEEKQIHDSAPVEKVNISNISKKKIKKENLKQQFVIILGNFYSLESAELLIKRIKNESQYLSDKKISILKKNKHNFEVFLGPYNTIKKIKNDYIALKQINFDEVDLKIYE